MFSTTKIKIQETTVINLRDFLALAETKQSPSFPSRMFLQCGGGQYGDDIAEQIANVLMSSHCPPDLVLDLWGNQISAAGAQHLAAPLMKKNSLKNLEIILDTNKIGEGIRYFADTFKSKHSPATLILSFKGNGIKDEDAIYFVDALKNPIYRQYLWLDFDNNPFSDATFHDFADAFLNNTNVMECKFSPGSDSAQDLDFIQHACLRNQLFEKYTDNPDATSYVNHVFNHYCGVENRFLEMYKDHPDKAARIKSFFLNQPTMEPPVDIKNDRELQIFLEKITLSDTFVTRTNSNSLSRPRTLL